MKRTRSLLLGLVLLCFAAPPASAQILPDLPVDVEASVTAGVPSGPLADRSSAATAGPSLGVAVGARWRIPPNFSIHGLYRYAAYRCGNCEDGPISRLADAGYELGARGDLPLDIGGPTPWMQASLLLAQRYQISGAEGSVVSDPATGYGIGAGATVPIAEDVSLAPGLHYRAYTASFDFSSAPLAGVVDPDATLSRDVDVSHVSVEVGLSYHF